jgi:hypothetical protein
MWSPLQCLRLQDAPQSVRMMMLPDGHPSTGLLSNPNHDARCKASSSSCFHYNRSSADLSTPLSTKTSLRTCMDVDPSEQEKIESF